MFIDRSSYNWRKASACGYCESPLPKKNKAGEQDKTGDHIPPRCWFTESENRQFKTIIKVTSCMECNNGYSAKDENSKHFLNMCVSQMQNDTEEQILLHKKTLDKNMRLKRALLDAEEVLVRDTSTGLYTFEKSVHMDSRYIKDTDEVIYRIARGLYWYHFNRPVLSADYNVEFLAGVNLRKFAHLDISRRRQRFALILDMQKSSTKIEIYFPVFTYWLSHTLHELTEGYFLIAYRNSALAYIALENMKLGEVALV